MQIYAHITDINTYRNEIKQLKKLLTRKIHQKKSCQTDCTKPHCKRSDTQCDLLRINTQ